MSMDKLTIRQKLYLIFGILILFFVGNGAYSVYSLSQVNDTTMRIATEHLRGVLTVADSTSELASYRQCEYAAVTATTVPERVRAILETKKIGDQIDIKLDAIEPGLSGDAADTFQSLRTGWTNYRKETDEVMNLARTHQRDAAINESSKSVAAETQSVSAATEEQSASMDEVAEASRKLADLAGSLQESTAQFQI